MFYANGTDTSSVYRELLEKLLEAPQCSPRGLLCREHRNALVEVEQPSDSPVVTRDEELNAKIAKYTRAEFELYASGTDATEKFAAHAPFWREVADGEHINSAYGKMVWFDKMPCGKTPWQWARDSLLDDRDSRQAVLQFIRPDHFKTGTKDMVCTVSGTFAVRDAKLHLCVHMRSNDLVRGFVYDVPWFQYLMLKMRNELAGPWDKRQLIVGIGTYSHFVDSLHVYERDVPRVLKMLGR